MSSHKHNPNEKETPQHSEKSSTMPRWSLASSASNLNRDLQNGRFSSLHFWTSHDPPHSTVSGGELINTEDDGPLPDPPNPDERPIPTRYLMQGISKFRDIPSSPPSPTMTNGPKIEWFEPSAPTPSLDPAVDRAQCASRVVNNLYGGVRLTVVVLFFLALIATVVARGRSRALRKIRKEQRLHRGQLRLRGQERRLQAYVIDMGEKDGDESFVRMGNGLPADSEC